MSGAAHYAEAERLLSSAWRRLAGGEGDLLHTHETRMALTAAAQVHATLALAAATALPHDPHSKTGQAWIEAAS